MSRNLKQIEKNKIIEKHLRFQDLLISISTKYINSDLSDIDAIIQSSLKQIGEFVEADRSYIFSYDFENKTSTNTYEWCAAGIDAEIDNLQEVPLEYLMQWVEAHEKGEPLYIDDVSLLPDEGERCLRGLLEPQGIKSLIAIPKIKNDKLIGFIGFDSVKKLKKYSDNEKNILFVYSNMIVNILQRKEQEEIIIEQEKNKEELLQSLSLQNQELNDYAHIVSHDLRAPLININALIELFIKGNKGVLSETDLIPLNHIVFTVKKMDSLIKGILDYSKVDKIESDESLIDFNVMLGEIAQTVLIPENIVFSIQGNLPSIFGNELRFKQVFQNLIQNAIKFSDKEKGLIEVGFTEKEDHYEFFVKDNGKGINASHFDSIFQKFTKLDSKTSSSGIGLSIVKRIIDYYKGSIWVTSEVGVGSTFYFTFFKNS
ncbi:GHKL domain-containing protein [Cellulophaga baltica]|uniref:GAF domain-containing sensor histidine kinase n=1 Tax=Cellulophaga TaxID=104264 RepID=UPI001C06B1D0|nr:MULTISPECIES: ATP-binding protein [Cellulophaga]MBU2996316.1 GHKL domain-containing protein [Cellulophaga baltica]MDO6767711.1 ATP-binding protein [Cellulophaga sp. 1_MG-2023]